jgi:hypothetical protein
MKNSKSNFITLDSNIEYLNVNEQGLLKGGYLVLNKRTLNIYGSTNDFTCSSPNIYGCGSRPPKK